MSERTSMENQLENKKRFFTFSKKSKDTLWLVAISLAIVADFYFLILGKTGD
jgi:hypothetical protein